MIDEIAHAVFERVEKAAQHLFVHALRVGHQDQLVIARHAFLLDIEGAAFIAFDGQLIELEIAVGADHRIDLAGEEGGREREIDVHQGDVVEGEAVAREHGAEQSVLEAADGKANLAAFQVRHGFDRTVFEYQQGIQGRRDQSGEAGERQAGGDLHVKLGLIGNRDIGLAGGDQLGRIIGIGRRDHLDLEPVFGEIAHLLGDEERRMVRVDEPVQQQGELVVRLGARRRQQQGEPGGQQNAAENFAKHGEITPLVAPASGRAATAGRGGESCRR